MNNKEMLYQFTGHSIDNIDADESFGYLTENIGTDGDTYFWYLDENESAAINTKTGEIIDDADEIDRLFGITDGLVFADETITGRVMDILKYAKKVIAENDDDADAMKDLLGEINPFALDDTVECWYHPMGAWNVHKV